MSLTWIRTFTTTCLIVISLIWKLSNWFFFSLFLTPFFLNSNWQQLWFYFCLYNKEFEKKVVIFFSFRCTFILIVYSCEANKKSFNISMCVYDVSARYTQCFRPWIIHHQFRACSSVSLIFFTKHSIDKKGK